MTLPGFDRPADLYECANAYGVHVSGINQLVEFAREILRRASTATNEEKEIKE